ncbi:hypothetical protein R80B4_01555 [Fibrobacteres bacterium R8-0-B4]
MLNRNGGKTIANIFLCAAVLLLSLSSEFGCAKKNNDGGGASVKEIDTVATIVAADTDTVDVIHNATLENKGSDSVESDGQLKKSNPVVIDTVAVVDISLKNNDGGKFSFKRFVLAISDSVNNIDDIAISFTYPAAIPNSAALVELQKNFINQAFGKEYAGLEPSAIVQRIGKERVDEAADVIETERAMDKAAEDVSCQYLSSFKDTVVFPISGFLQYETYYSDYTCGAHGNYGSQTSLYSLTDGMKIEPRDIFVKGWEQNVTKLIVEEYLQEEGEKSLKDVNGGYAEEKDFIPDCGMLSFTDSNGITFVYGTYRIGPYSAGYHYILLSWDKLKPYLNKQSVLYPKLKIK